MLVVLTPEVKTSSKIGTKYRDAEKEELTKIITRRNRKDRTSVSLDSTIQPLHNGGKDGSEDHMKYLFPGEQLAGSLRIARKPSF